MPLRLVYSASLVPCRDEAVEAVLRHHVDFKLRDSFRIVVPDLESRVDMERRLLADPRLGEVLIGKSLLTWPALIQNLLRELPTSRPLPNPALQRRALRAALAEAKLDWKLDLDSERRLIRELQQILRQHGPGPAFNPGARLAQAWQKGLAERFGVWSAEQAAERVWAGLPSREWREFAGAREIYFLGFRSPEPNFLRGVYSLLQRFPAIHFHLYLPPREPLAGEEGRWLPWRDSLEAWAESFEQWEASPPSSRRLVAFPTVIHEAGKLLAQDYGPDRQLLIASVGELAPHLEARYLTSLGLALPNLSGSHAALSAELLSVLSRDLGEEEETLKEFLGSRESLFAEFQTRLARAADGDGLRLLEAYLEKLKEQEVAQQIDPERRKPAQWLEEIREEWLSLRIHASGSAKALPWRRLDRPGIASPDSLWIAGLQDGAVPTVSNAAFFEDEKPFALAAWEEKFAFEQTLRSAATELTFSFAEFSLDGRPTSVSPWLDHLVAAEEQRIDSELSLGAPGRSTYWEENLRREASRRSTESFGVDSGNLSGLGLDDLLLDQMRARPLSPTYLDNLAKCPWSFFARRHLKLAREPEEDLEIDPRRRGSLQHRLLEAAFADLILGHFDKGGRPTFGQIEESLERVYAALAAETMAEASPIPPVLLQDQLERMREIARFLLAEEQQSWTEAKSRLIPHRLEWSFGRGSVPPLEVELEGGLRLPLKGQIDRIDRSEDGKYFLLIDYKSSRASDMASELREGLSLQLWIYLQAVRRSLFRDAEPLGALYWDLKEGSKNQGMARRELYKDFTHRNKFGGSKSMMKNEEYEEVSSLLETRLRSLLKRAVTGDYALNPEKCSGFYCDYFEICRYGNKPRN